MAESEIKPFPIDPLAFNQAREMYAWIIAHQLRVINSYEASPILDQDYRNSLIELRETVALYQSTFPRSMSGRKLKEKPPEPEVTLTESQQKALAKVDQRQEKLNGKTAQ